MKKLTIIAASTFLAGTLFLGSTSAIADGVFASGPYIGASGFISIRKDEPSDFFGFVTSNARPFVGYRVNDHIAVEAGYDNIDKYSGHCFFSNTATCSFSMQGADTAVLLSQPLGNRVNIYVKGGAAIMKTKINTPPLGGIGLYISMRMFKAKKAFLRE